VPSLFKQPPISRTGDKRLFHFPFVYNGVANKFIAG
jgi:hypothetical protein